MEGRAGPRGRDGSGEGPRETGEVTRGLDGRPGTGAGLGFVCNPKRSRQSEPTLGGGQARSGGRTSLGPGLAA